MKPLPFPVRLAAGLAAVTAQRAQALPKQLLGLPVTVASQVLHISMRLQQNITELAIRGDDALAALRPVDEAPSWATFDEDAATPEPNEPRPAPQGGADPTAPDPFARNGTTHHGTTLDFDTDPWVEEQRALSHDYAEGTFDSTTETSTAEARTAEPGSGDSRGQPGGLLNYDELTLPQLRARLRQFSAEQLTEILEYERTHANRSSFTGMLSRRIENIRKEPGSGPGQDDPER